MPMTLFDAIQEILWKTQNGEWREIDGKFINGIGITCSLEKELMDSPDNINWTL